MMYSMTIEVGGMCKISSNYSKRIGNMVFIFEKQCNADFRTREYLKKYKFSEFI